MTPEQVVAALKQMHRDELKEVALLASKMFGEKAEAKYLEDPENNGREAQPLADIASCLEHAAFVWDDALAPSAAEDASEEDPIRPTTVSQAVSSGTKDPWGGR